MLKKFLAVIAVAGVLGLGATARSEETMNNAMSGNNVMMNEGEPMEQSETMEDMEDAQDGKYSFGTVVSVNVNQIVLKEYDYDKDEEVDVTYEVNADVKFENAGALKDIVKDDEVEIYWKDADGKKVATIISKSEDNDDQGNSDMDAPASTEAAPNPSGAEAK